jgi:hypothetical protein
MADKRGSPDKFCPGREVECLPLAVIFMFPRLLERFPTGNAQTGDCLLRQTIKANALNKRACPEAGIDNQGC